jgi:hypothetical protein
MEHQNFSFCTTVNVEAAAMMDNTNCSMLKYRHVTFVSLLAKLAIIPIKLVRPAFLDMPFTALTTHATK